MGEWSPSIASPATRDFLSLYTTKTQTSPVYNMNGTTSELTFSPPRNGSLHQYIEEEEDGVFCNRQNVDDCVSFLNKVRFVFFNVLFYLASAEYFTGSKNL